MENYSRRSNLIFEGIIEPGDESSEMLYAKLLRVFATLGIDNAKQVTFRKIPQTRYCI